MKCEWFTPQDEGLLMNSPRFESCRRCGRVRSSGGASDIKECRGLVRVSLRHPEDLLTSEQRDQLSDDLREMAEQRSRSWHALKDTVL